MAEKERKNAEIKVRLPEEEKLLLQEMADDLERSVSSVVRKAIRSYASVMRERLQKSAEADLHKGARAKEALNKSAEEDLRRSAELEKASGDFEIQGAVKRQRGEERTA